MLLNARSRETPLLRAFSLAISRVALIPMSLFAHRRVDEFIRQRYPSQNDALYVVFNLSGNLFQDNPVESGSMYWHYSLQYAWAIMIDLF